MAWNLDTDAPIPTAAELNRAITELRRQGKLFVAPPLKAFYSPGMGWLLRITGASVVSTLVARVYQSNGNVYAWRQQIQIRGAFVDMAGGLQSDTNVDPALELNGQANIPPGTAAYLARIFSPTFKKAHWVFSHPKHQPTSFVVNDYGRGNDMPSYSFDFGIRRPGWYWKQEPVAVVGNNNLCDFCDTNNSVSLPSPFGSFTGIPGRDGVYSLTTNATAGTLAVQFGSLGGDSQSFAFNATAAQVQSALQAGFAGINQYPAFGMSDSGGTPFVSCSGGPLGTAPVIITAHQNPFIKQAFGSAPVLDASLLTGTAIITATQTPTFGFVLNGFYPARLTLSITGPSAEGPFTLFLDDSGAPNDVPRYEAFGGGADYQIDPFQYLLLLSDTKFTVGSNVSGFISGPSPNKLRCWPLHLEYDNVIDLTSGSNTVTVDGIYF